ncbi:RNA ligase [Halomicrobium salinisoli]|uniref:RNA ligase n=1 Tax=Halomicrobium salinisoli TaxID=2878391 RepID=UPI001CF0CC4D|nr:RNA ligase [Halomicrobium salinisoli]
MHRDFAAALDVDVEPADLAEHVDVAAFRGREYRLLPDERHGVERGTVFFGGDVVRGYPSVSRTLVLDPGVTNYFEERLIVEEKLDGSNVRVTRAPDDWAASVLALTRSGYVCPYATHLAAEREAITDFLADHPDRVLCCELVGPDTPYTDHDYPDVDGAGLFVFDVRGRASGDPLPVPERRRHCEAYGLRQVSAFGTYEPRAAVGAVRRSIEHLDRRGREGVVMQSLSGDHQLKYTTSAIHRSDLEHAFSMPFDYGRQFLFSRLIREAFQAVEFEDDDEAVRERARALGESILPPMVETIRAVEDGEPVGESHEVRGDPQAIEDLLAHFRDLGITLSVERDERTDGERAVAFTKVAETTRDKTEYYLAGGTRDE